jgi:histidine triad (HIT) family protein
MTSETSVFTKIIHREIPATIIYEDDTVIAFFTIEPINYGHTLVVPKSPFVNIFDGDDATLGHMMQVAAKIGRALVDTTVATGVNIIMNNGSDASQEVFHAHLHVVPRTKSDNAFTTPQHIIPRTEENARVAELLRNAVNTPHHE